MRRPAVTGIVGGYRRGSAPIGPVCALSGNRYPIDSLDGEGDKRMTASRSAAAIWLIAILAACGSDSSGPPTGPSGVPTCKTVQLAPGEDVIFEGSAAVSCLDIPAYEARTQYEVVVSTMARTLGFSPMELRVSPTGKPRVTARTVPGYADPARTVPGPDMMESAWRAGQTSLDAEMRQMERSILPQIRSTATATRASLFSVPFVGDTVRYQFTCVDRKKFPDTPSSILGEVRHVSRRAVIVEDRSSASEFSSAEYAEIAQAFDEVIYDMNVKYFGSPRDIDANGERIVLLYTSGVNQMSTDYTLSFIAGFTCPLDLGASSGNQAEMFYLMVPDPDGLFTESPTDAISKEQVRRITDNTVAHELQHLINAQSGNGGAQDVWLNEGLSHLAEEVVGHAVNGFAPGMELGAEELISSQSKIDVFNKYYLNNWYNLSQYLSTPGDTAALLNSSDPLNYNTFRMRGAAWSFLRYLLDRYEDGTDGEAGRTRALVQSSAADSRDAVTEVFGSPFDRLATQWSTMLISSDRSDVETSMELQLPSYRVRNVFESRIGEAVNPPSGGYPLLPVKRDLGYPTTLDAELFSATGLYLELSSLEPGDRTRLELVSPTHGGVLDSSVEPRLQILRVR